MTFIRFFAILCSPPAKWAYLKHSDDWFVYRVVPLIEKSGIYQYKIQRLKKFFNKSSVNPKRKIKKLSTKINREIKYLELKIWLILIFWGIIIIIFQGIKLLIWAAFPHTYLDVSLNIAVNSLCLGIPLYLAMFNIPYHFSGYYAKIFEKEFYLFCIEQQLRQLKNQQLTTEL